MFEENRIPLREWINDGVRWLRAEYREFFRDISDQIEALIDGMLFVLDGPMMAVYGGILLLALLAGGWRLALFAGAGFALISNLGLWGDAMDTIALVLASGLVCLLIGVPLGVASAKWSGLEKVVRPTLDFMQTMPAFVYLIPAITFFRVGPVSALFATVVFALPPIVRLVTHGVQHVDKEMTEASEAFGATAWQTLLKVQLPLARPSILVGINQMLMMSLSMVVIAAMVGAQGLGGVVYEGISRIDSGLAFEGGISIVIVAVVLDRITQGLGQARTIGERRPFFTGMRESFRRTMRSIAGGAVAPVEHAHDQSDGKS